MQFLHGRQLRRCGGGAAGVRRGRRGGPPIQRGIDGILLTKFDTIDDKVGTAVSMVYQSGQPIVFVGVGQQYQDLRSLNPGVVVRSLLR
eukprot:gene17648-biopygen1723